MNKIFLFSTMLMLAIACSSNKKSTQFNGSNFTMDQSQLILSGDADAPMRVFKITSYEDSILLRKKSNDVLIGRSDATLKRCIDRIYATVRDSMSLGVGIAAPQVGILKNIIWVQRFDKEDFPFEYYLNPRILKYTDKKQDCREGCLSIPDRSDMTKNRAYAVLIEYDTLEEQGKVEMIEGFTAVIFQHEIDHLRGILYLDHLEQEIKEAK